MVAGHRLFYGFCASPKLFFHACGGKDCTLRIDDCMFVTHAVHGCDDEDDVELKCAFDMPIKI